MVTKDWFRTISAVLGDDEPGRPFQRYPIKDLIEAYNRGLSIVYAYRPDVFTRVEIVELSTGSYQDVGGCCDNVLDVLSQTDSKGNTIKEFSGTKSTSKSEKVRWNKPSCLTHLAADKKEVDYIIDFATIDTGVNGAFQVHPPVPRGVSAYVRIKCVKRPCYLVEADINMEFDKSDFHNTAIWHYVLSSMLVGDRYAQGAFQEGRDNFNKFLGLLQLGYLQEKEIEAEGTKR